MAANKNNSDSDKNIVIAIFVLAALTVLIMIYLGITLWNKDSDDGGSYGNQAIPVGTYIFNGSSSDIHIESIDGLDISYIESSMELMQPAQIQILNNNRLKIDDGIYNYTNVNNQISYSETYETYLQMTLDGTYNDENKTLTITFEFIIITDELEPIIYAGQGYRFMMDFVKV